MRGRDVKAANGQSCCSADRCYRPPSRLIDLQRRVHELGAIRRSSLPQRSFRPEPAAASTIIILLAARVFGESGQLPVQITLLVRAADSRIQSHAIDRALSIHNPRSGRELVGGHR